MSYAPQERIEPAEVSGSFPTEDGCEEFLFQQKWPDGFICPKCGCREFYHIKGRKLYQCKHCRHQSSVTTNTVMHRTHKPLTTWFQDIYFVASDKRGISACTLAGKLDISYETAWYMLVRIRKAMDHRESRYMLAGIVELDDSYFGAKIKGKRGRAAGNQSVIVCVPKDSKDRSQFMKMTVVLNVQRSTVEQFVDPPLKKAQPFKLIATAAISNLSEKDTTMSPRILIRTVSI